MEYYISTDTGSVYWIDPLDNKTLMYTGINSKNTVVLPLEGDPVDEDLMKGEEYQPGKTFDQLYAKVRKALGDG